VQLPVRRAVFFTLVGLTIAGMFALMAYALSDGGLDWVDGLILTLNRATSAIFATAGARISISSSCSTPIAT
jgi:hypothetical protein